MTEPGQVLVHLDADAAERLDRLCFVHDVNRPAALLYAINAASAVLRDRERRLLELMRLVGKPATSRALILGCRPLDPDLTLAIAKLLVRDDRLAYDKDTDTYRLP